MEAIPHHSPQTQHLSSASPLDHMLSHRSDSPSSPQFLKMEDLDESSPAPEDLTLPSASQTSPPPVFVQSKPAKKRKSWGQELPEPKTTLPPRKRAKTDDEKEQRRIERIKRNRAAAHNSRERKRQETETLAVALAKANAELEAYKKLHGPLPAHIVLPEVHLSVDNSEMTSATTPAPSLVESHGSLQDPPSPPSPVDSVFHQVKQEPFESSFPINFPPVFDSLDAKPAQLSPLDPTQHSAEMLCDLQCRSRRVSSSRNNNSSTTMANSWWTKLFLYLMTLQLQTCYRTLLVALWTLSPSRMARWTQASTLRSISRSTISSTTLRPSLRLRSTPRRLALCNAATGLGAPTTEGALSLDRERNSSLEQASVRSGAYQNQSDRVAFGEQVVTVGTEDQNSMGDEGDENGVRRGGADLI